MLCTDRVRAGFGIHEPTLLTVEVSNLYIDVKSIDPTMTPSPILQGTLDLLILKTLSIGALHGYGIAQHIHRLSNDALRVEEGSLYPALRRMQTKGWVTSEMKRTPTGRDARYYKITAAGRKQLAAEQKLFQSSVAATTLVLEGTE